MGDIDTQLQTSVLELVKSDVLAADLRWSLFIGALDSYRHDSVLRPYPPGPHLLTPDGEKDFSALKSVAGQIPNMKMLSEGRGLSGMQQEEWDLLKWVLEPNVFSVKSVDVEKKYRAIQDLTGAASYEVKPSFIFEVEYHSAAGDRFKTLSEEYDVLYAYHGSRWDNFHSITSNGLHAHMSKNTLYGEGTYLSSDLAVSLPYSPAGRGWTRSLIGSTLSCVAVCAMLDHPDVKCQVKDTQSNPSPSRSHAPDSLGGAVPERYYVVTNSETVQIKYLLIFADKKVSQGSSTRVSHRQRWIREHLFSLLLVGYIIVLVLVSFVNSRSFQSMWRRYVNS
ncbi:protein mono-ADP-ribosyltransferase PARP16-like [Lytechinus variegatus]|uniref:protein mono-ADP-ribosyltransferase PARP16-like n=1 Tax=Lytechinus variegatus TaxID=7654 RepID=UPI001BB2305F|nr:protein mono-ADP-ribosyltransferase PARP16-like [Lytechinus variegatus]